MCHKKMTGASFSLQISGPGCPMHGCRPSVRPRGACAPTSIRLTFLMLPASISDPPKLIQGLVLASHKPASGVRSSEVCSEPASRTCALNAYSPVPLLVHGKIGQILRALQKLECFSARRIAIAMLAIRLGTSGAQGLSSPLLPVGSVGTATADSSASCCLPGCPCVASARRCVRYLERTVLVHCSLVNVSRTWLRSPCLLNGNWKGLTLSRGNRITPSALTSHLQGGGPQFPCRFAMRQHYCHTQSSIHPQSIPTHLTWF